MAEVLAAVALVEMDLFMSTIKMYAVVDNKVIVSPFVGNEQQLKEQQSQYPNYKFIEMTLENSPVMVGDKI